MIDALRYIRTGDTNQASLRVPKKVRDRIHKAIRAGLTTRGLVIDLLRAGFVVSIRESLSTGQLYPPKTVFMTRVPGIPAAALRYLLLYNVMFVLPLVAFWP